MVTTKPTKKFAHVPTQHLSVLKHVVSRDGAQPVADRLHLSTSGLYSIMKNGSGVRPSTLAKVGSLVEHERRRKSDVQPLDLIGTVRGIKKLLQNVDVNQRKAVLELCIELLDH